MKRTFAHLLTAIGLVSTAALPLSAEDYQCQRAAGCVAQIPCDGELSEIAFRKGDIVSTDDGWIVSLADGWSKVRSKRGQTTDT